MIGFGNGDNPSEREKAVSARYRYNSRYSRIRVTQQRKGRRSKTTALFFTLPAGSQGRCRKTGILHKIAGQVLDTLHKVWYNKIWYIRGRNVRVCKPL
jgi:hypothetical protein